VLGRIEVRIGPDRTQLGVADGVGVGRILHVNRIADRRHFASWNRVIIRRYVYAVGGHDPDHLTLGPRWLASVRPGHIVDLLPGIAVLVPALDDLNAVEVAAVRVFQRPDRERRRLGALRFWR